MYQKIKPSGPPRNKGTRLIGLLLEKAVAMVTANPSRVFDYGAQIGTLRPRSEVNVNIFELRESKFDFEDSDGIKRTSQRMLANRAVVRRAQLFMNAI
jgi:predicted amidohydrolase